MTKDAVDHRLRTGIENETVSKATINSEAELKAALNIRGELLLLEFSWAERATVFLSQDLIRLFLFVGMLVFAWMEISHPGVTVPGIAAVVCLVLLVGAPFLTGLAQVWEIALIVIGLGIIVADLVAFGGVGMLAIPGFILMAIGLVASFVPAEPGGNWVPTMASTWTAIEQGLAVVVGGSFMALIAFYLLGKYLYMTPGFNKLQLAPATGAGIAADGMPRPASGGVRDAMDRPVDDAVFVGALGVAATDLRPAGKVRFGEHLVGVQSDGSFIAMGQVVIVIEILGARVVVKRHVENAGADGADEGAGGMFA